MSDDTARTFGFLALVIFVLLFVDRRALEREDAIMAAQARRLWSLFKRLVRRQ